MLSHLIRRFFGHITARALSPSEQHDISEWLTAPLRELFYAQPVGDQRHAYSVAARVPPHLREAALLHDVGKSMCGIGAVQRSLATVWAWLGLPVWGAWECYLTHGHRGAALIEIAGGSELSVAFARHHPGPTPEGFDGEAWFALSTADDA